MANPLDLVERAVERTRKTGPRDGWATIGWHEFTLLADAAARAAELERELAKVRGSLDYYRERAKGWEGQAYAEARQRDAALARAGELEELADDHQEQIASLHERMTVAQDRAESLTTDLHEMRETAEFRSQQHQKREHELLEMAGRFETERDQLRAERDRLLADNATFHNQLAESVSERVSLQQDLQAMEEKLSHEDELYGRLSKEYTQVAAALRTRLAAAEGALRPFAWAGAAIGPMEGSITIGSAELTFAHFRAARAALAPSTGEYAMQDRMSGITPAAQGRAGERASGPALVITCECRFWEACRVCRPDLFGERQEGEFRRNCECTAERVCRYCEVVHGKL